MGESHQVSIVIAFCAGFLSFISPCVLPLVPSYITYITGVSFTELAEQEGRSRLRWATVAHSCLFIVGFSFVFVLMGASASYLGQLLARYQYWIMRIGGIVIIIMGIRFSGLIRIPFLDAEKRFELKRKPLGYAGSFITGLVFAAGWTPCIGPILSAILIYASTSQSFTTGVLLLAVYSLGLGIPFFIASLAFNMFLSAFKKIRSYMKAITTASGVFLIILGILFVSDMFRTVTSYLNILGSP